MVENGATENISTDNQNILRIKRLIELLQSEIELRRKYFNDNIVNGYGWDVLLELLIVTNEKRHASITAVSTLGGMKAATGLRWINALINEGLVTVATDVDDAHKTLVALTDQGKKGMQSYLKAVAELRQLKPTDRELADTSM